MQVHIPAELAFGACPGSIRPPQLCAAFIVKATFRLAPGELKYADEPDLVAGDVHEEGDPTRPLIYASDFALFKPRTDFIVVGQARPPQGTAVQRLRTGISVGSYAKVFDARSAAGPFTALPLAHRWVAEPPPLPKQRDRLQPPELVGFGPVPAGWPQRQALTGTYDERYMKARWPWFPEDFDYGYFNAAPRDQQLDGGLRGDEQVVLQHLHAEQPMLRTRLPGLRVRCFLQMRGADGSLAYREPQMRLDTLAIDVEAAKLVLVWRGIAEVRTPKMSDVEQVVVVTEPLSDTPRPASAYAAAFVPAPQVKDDAAEAEAKATELKFTRLELDMAAMSQRMAGMDADFSAAETQIEAEAAAADREPPVPITVPPMPAAAAGVRAALAPPVEEAPKVAATVATGDVNINLDAGADAGANADADPAIDPEADAFAVAETEFAAMAKTFAALDAEMTLDRWTRERVAAAAAAHTPMTDLDIAGLDLSGLDLAGQDLSGSRLSGANLENADLAGARLMRCDLAGAQLAEADLTGADLSAADLSDAILHGAMLERLSLNRTRLAGLDLAGTDLTGSTGREANFARADLSGACLAGVRMPSADFTASRLDQAEFTGADLSRASFAEASAPRIDFTGAVLDGLQAEAADFSGACFHGVSALGAIFDAAKLDGADMARARLVDAQFEGASLRGTNLDRADLTGAMLDEAGLQGAVFSHAKLLRTSFEGADLTGARAEGANGYETGFWRALGAEEAFRHADLKSTLLR